MQHRNTHINPARHARRSTRRLRLVAAVTGLTLVGAACSSTSTADVVAPTPAAEPAVALERRTAERDVPASVALPAATPRPAPVRAPEPAPEPTVIDEVTTTPLTPDPDPVLVDDLAPIPSTPSPDRDVTPPPVIPDPDPVPRPADEILASPSRPDPRPGPADDLATPPVVPDPDPVLVDDIAAPGSGPCGVFGPIPGDALIGTDGIYNLNDSDEVRLVTYSDGSTWRLRQQWGTIVSEVEIPDAGVHGVRVIGLANVAALGGDEILATVGGGASAVEIGVFSSFEGPCLFRYQQEGGGDFGLLSGGSINSGSGIMCGDEWISMVGYELQGDGFYDVWGEAYQETAPGSFGLIPESQAFASGLPADEFDIAYFDCNGLSL